MTPLEIRIAALRAIVALDTTIRCRNPNCEAVCTAAISALLPLAVRIDGPEDFDAAKELAAALWENGEIQAASTSP